MNGVVSLFDAARDGGGCAEWALAQDFNGDVEAIQVVGGTPKAAADPRGRGVAMTIR